MKEYILFVIVLLCFIYLTKQYYKQINDESIALLKNEPIDIDAYFYSDDYIKQSKRRKLWIHIPYEKNSREWINFGSRSSNKLNLPYMILCIKSIIDYCGDTYDIIIIDDTNIPNLLNNDIDLLKLSGSLKEKYREMCLLKILYQYGGVIVPPSLYLKKSIKQVDNPNIWYIVEIVNTTSVSNLNTHTSTIFSGSSKNNKDLKKYIDTYESEIKNDFGEQSLHFNTNYITKNNIYYLDGKMIGVKDKYGNIITIDDLMENKQIILDVNNIGLYIPHDELMKRKKHNWYCYLNFEEVLKCNIFISYYMLSKT
jgi:hypothetical protein